MLGLELNHVSKRGHRYSCIKPIVHTVLFCCGQASAGSIHTLIARFAGPTRGLSGADRTQVGPMLAPWTLLSGYPCGLCRKQRWSPMIAPVPTKQTRSARVTLDSRINPARSYTSKESTGHPYTCIFHYMHCMHNVWIASAVKLII